MEVHSCQDEYKNVEIHQILDLSDNVGLALPRSFRIVVFSLISCQYWASNEVIQSTKLSFGAFFLCSASPSVCVCVCVCDQLVTHWLYLPGLSTASALDYHVPYGDYTLHRHPPVCSVLLPAHHAGSTQPCLACLPAKPGLFLHFTLQRSLLV